MTADIVNYLLSTVELAWVKLSEKNLKNSIFEHIFQPLALMQTIPGFVFISEYVTRNQIGIGPQGGGVPGEGVS